MRVRDWRDMVEDVVERDVDPDDWRAVAGDRRRGVGEDLFLAHPAVGVFQLKTYAKNPFEVQGIGTRVARRVDEDVESVLPDRDRPQRFAVQTPPDDEDEAEQVASRVEEVVRTHAEAPTAPGDLFDDVMDAMEAPAFGPLEYDQYDRPEPVDELSTTFEEAEEVLEAEFEDLIEDAGVDRGFQ